MKHNRAEKMNLRSLISSGSTKAPRGIVSSTKSVHLMIKKVLLGFDVMDPYLGDQHSVLEQLWVVEVNRVLWSGARSVGANARVPH